MPSYKAVGIICLIFISFAFVHSLCVTGFIKGLVKRLFGERFVKAFYRLLYTCFSFATTAGAAYFIFQLPDATLWGAPLYLRIAMHFVQGAGFVFGALSFRAIDSFEFVGLSQAWRYLTKREVKGDAEGLTGDVLVTGGVYGVVRHPLYLAGIIIFTFQPVITRNWLVVSVLSDMYFVFGAFIEERRLISRFGDEYVNYMKKVPRFLPRLRKS